MSQISAFADEISPNLGEAVRVLSEEGIRYVELRKVNGKGILDLTDAEIVEIRDTLDAAGIRVSAIGSPIGKLKIADDFNDHLLRLERAVGIAKVFGTRYVRMFSFWVQVGEHAGLRAEIIRRIKRMVEVAEENDVMLCLENERGTYADTPDHCLEILEAVRSPFLRCVFDPANCSGVALAHSQCIPAQPGNILVHVVTLCWNESLADDRDKLSRLCCPGPHLGFCAIREPEFE